LKLHVASAGTPSNHRRAALSSARVVFYDGLRSGTVESSTTGFPGCNA